MRAIARTSAFLLLLAMVPASAGETLCHRAAASLQIGQAAPPTLIDGLKEVSEARQEDDAPAVLRGLRAALDLLGLVGDMTAAGQIRSRIHWLVHGKLGAIEVVAGTAKCQTLLFFRVLDGKAVGTPAPQGLNTDQACWGDSVWLGTIGGTPYAVEQNNVLGDRGRSIAASAWSGASWEPGCSLVETHSVTLAVENLFCRPGTDCTALQEVALERARAMEAEYERVTPAIGPVNPPGQNETGPVGLPQEIPTFNATTRNPFTTFTNQQVFQTSYMGQQIVGAIGAGHWGWRDYDGWLVAFWRVGKDGYDPLAGLQISRPLGAIRSLSVQDP